VLLSHDDFNCIRDYFETNCTTVRMPLESSSRVERCFNARVVIDISNVLPYSTTAMYVE
jgi:hypothetical protein